MPLYEWTCPKCGLVDEHLMSYERSLEVEVVCKSCSLQMKKMVSLIAKTPAAWHSNWSAGMSHTYFSKALGKHVANRREEEKILNKRGFVSEADLPQYWYEDKMSEVVQKRKEQDRIADTYNSLVKSGVSKEDAIVQTFPAEKCLDGTFDSIYDNKITT